MKKKNTYSGETGIELLPHGIELGINQAQRNENPRKEVELEEGGGELEAENRKWRSGRQNQRKRACVRGDLSDPKVALAVSETNEVLLLLIQRSIRPYEFDEENIKRKKKNKETVAKMTIESKRLWGWRILTGQYMDNTWQVTTEKMMTANMGCWRMLVCYDTIQQ